MNKHYHKYKQGGDCGGKRFALLKLKKRDTGASTQTLKCIEMRVN